MPDDAFEILVARRNLPLTRELDDFPPPREGAELIL
jgi:hypothetical protein